MESARHLTAWTAQPAARLLLVTEDSELAQRLGALLRCYGFDPTWVAEPESALPQAAAADLVLFHVSPADALGVLRCASLAASAAVIVLSGPVDEADRVAALDAGADDYIIQPFASRELVARCRSVLRRRRATPQASLIRIGDLVLDPERFEVRRHDELLELTTKEFSLLLALGRRPGTVVRREELVEEVWGVGAWAANRSLDVHMSALRRKLGDSPHRPRYIRTVHGLGFRLVADAPGQATGRAPRDAA